jgi:uracil-DNA glycosylase
VHLEDLQPDGMLPGMASVAGPTGTAPDVTADALLEHVHPSWAPVFEESAEDIASLAAFLGSERDAGRPWLPAEDVVLRAFRVPLESVRVLIVGQDPYPTPGHPIGLSFSVDPHVRPVPRSLRNIYRELQDDLGVEPPAHGDLSRWAGNGVMLLNRVLTVGEGIPGSHRRRGWERVTERAIRLLAARDAPLVAILWGRDAHGLVPLLGSTPVVASAHPSPLAASRGFFGSRPFSRTNALLEGLGAPSVDWSLG